ncbi:hypothetical protein HHK36_023295 [Tetracentron sinense]|uniref:Uncharacterized protein n=1 Tax=Tetracentron sinense TaxID=13715 RepID=A0A834YMW5_TETSI|nr:hypothetical protein HHK36_023295 [Tetracentron sinense]
MTVFSATLLLPCRVENGENVEGKGLDNNAKKTLSEEIQINMPNPVFLCARSPCDTVQVMETNSSLNELSGILMDGVVKNTAIEEIQIDMPNRVSLCVRSQCDTVQKVVSNINSTTTDQAEMNTEETTNLLHQTPNESRDSTANNCLIGLTVESMEESLLQRGITEIIGLLGPKSQDHGRKEGWESGIFQTFQQLSE